jgi:pimeloyl-ACP methyl ester carboxylesterase
MMLKAPETTATGAFAWILDPGIWKGGEISVPSLAIYAGTAQNQLIEDTKKRVQGVQTIQIESTGHFLMMEQPAKFNETVLAFVEKVKF